jgi:hypothetical protein
MSAGSVSRIVVNLQVKDRSQLKCELKRHLAPKTVGTITRSLPLEGNVHRVENSFVYFETKINVGGERQRNQFKKGEIAFMASTGSICFFINETGYTKPLTPIGMIISNVDELNNVKPGDVFIVTQAEV